MEAKTVMVFNHEAVPLLLLRTNISLGQIRSESGFTAVAQVNIAGDMRERVAAHVAAGNAFSLFQFTVFPYYKHSRSQRAIKVWESFIHERNLQCIHGPNNDRTGVVVRRVDGDIELWDDRQLREPVIYLQGADRGC